MAEVEELVKGLTAQVKNIPLWYRYDEEGSRLNDLCIEKCQTYYYHRSETELLRSMVKDLSEDDFNILVDLGCGNGEKTKLYIEKLLQNQAKITYVPVDISADYLKITAEAIQSEYPGKLNIHPIGKEYLKAFEEIRQNGFDQGKLFLWLGGGFQNLPYDDQIKHLTCLSKSLAETDRILLTVDITDQEKKELIESAYLDSEGYGKALFLNAIHRLNKEYDANIELSHFDIMCKFNPVKSENRCSYVSVWLEAKWQCSYKIDKLNITINFDKGEKLYLHSDESLSCKYSMKQVQSLVDQSSLRIEKSWTNDHIAAVLLRSV